MKKLRIRLYAGVLVAFGVCLIPQFLAAEATERRIIAARVVSVSPDQATVVINRGKGENVVPGSSCFIRPNRGKNEADIEWDVYFAKGVIQSVTAESSVVKLTVVGPEKVQPRDYCGVEADIPAAVAATDLGQIAINDIVFLDHERQSPLFLLRDLIKDSSPRALEAIYEKLLQEIRSTPAAVIAEKYLEDVIPEGRFSGLPRQDVFRSAARKQVEEFVGYRAWFGGQLINYDWLLIDSFVNWVETGGKSGDSERRLHQAGPAVRRAESFLVKEEFAAALAEYNQALLIDPENSGIKSTVETVNRVLDRRRMLEEDAKDVTTRYGLGVDLFNLGLTTGALEQFLKAKELGSDTTALTKYLGCSYASLGQYAEALKVLEPLAAQFPDDSGITLWLDYSRESEILARQGPNVSSYLTIGKARYSRGSYDDAIADFNSALEIAPLDKDIWLNIAKTVARRRAGREERWAEELWRTGKFTEALGRWKAAIDLCKAAEDEEAAEGIIRKMGASLFDADFHEQAITLYRRILAKHPQDASSHFEIARCYLELKDYASAIQWAKTGLALDPNEAWGYNILGAVYKATGDLDQAISTCKKAVEITPQYAEANWRLGDAHALKGDYEKAESYFRRTLEIDNNYGSARNGLVSLECIRETLEALRSKPADNTARIRLAKALFNLGDYDRAMIHLQEMIRAGKDVAQAREQLGYCLVREEKFREGKLELDESYRLDPKPDVRAWILFSEARLLLQKNPSDPEATITLGQDSLYWESYAEALSHFQKALDLGGDPATVTAKMELARKGQEARRQLDLATDFYNRAQYEKAVEYGEQSLALNRELGAGRGEVNALQWVGWSFAAMFKHDEALRYYNLAGQAAIALRRESVEAQYLSNLGDYYAALGDYEKSLGYRQRAGELWHEINDLLNEALVALPEIGSLKFRLGDLSAELECYSRALAVHQKLHYPRGEASVLSKFASAYVRQGDYSRAIESYQKALAIAQKYAIRGEALSAYSGLGSIYASLGDVENARRYLQRYLDTAVALGERSERANALNNLGLLNLETTKDYEKAMGYFEDSQSLAKLIGYRLMEGVAAANIAVVYSRQGKYREALGRHEEALRIVRESKDKYLEMQGLNEKGETLFGLKEYDLALDCQLKARELAEFFGARSEQWLYELAAGKVYEAKGEAPKAVEYYQKAAETLKGIRNRISSEKLLKDFGEQEKQTDVYKRLIGLLLKAGQTEEAFRFIEESKSKIVKDAFGDAKPTTADVDLKQTLLSVDKMEAKKEALESELREEKKKPEEARDAKKIEILSKTLASTEGEFNQWMITLKFQNRKMYDALSIKPASLGDVQRDIPTGAVFLEYFIAPEELYVFCIGKDFFLARSTAIAEPELNTLVNRFLRQCQEPPSGGTERLLPLAKQLYQVLVAPVDDIIEKYETVVVVPFGILYYVPFQALVKETGGKPEYLIERKRLCYTTSATFADILKNESRGNKTFMAFGNPDGSLPAATEEMRTLREKFFKADTKVFTAGEATKDAFLRQAKDVNILHLATHGVLETNPLDSYLLFAGASKKAQELTLLEVAGYTALREKNSLVFLSACQTAKEAAKSGTGSELITLAEAFAMAGAPTLVATLWEVEDNSTRIFALAFYDALMIKKKDKLDALRAGQIALIRSAEYSHPFYWASFIMIGSWR
ncbi:MAG: tetratricopeptide repeat protein [Candidatus Aminicenantes bacterium]|nr:tetratricopeptide repeat protein [Candidatus Aminicenantes bacterium]